MKTKPIPAIVMLTAGFITCIVAIFQKMELLAFTKTLLLVLIIFYLLGGIAAYILEKNFKAAKDEESSTEEKADGDAEESADEKKEDTSEKSEKEEEKRAKEEYLYDTGGYGMKTVDRENLWESYQKNPGSDIREQIIIEYAPLVKLVAGRLSMYLGYNVEYEDLVSYGIFGLIDAIDKFDRSKDVKFETYASLRIRGAILDQIRKMDWIPRAVRQKQKKIDEAIKNIEMKTGKTALDEEIASELGVSEDEYLNWQSQLKVTNVVSLNEFVEQGTEPAMDATKNSHFAQPEDVVAESELKEVLAQSLETLTEKERRVIELYYYEELTLKEISSILEVSESRISQLHTRALAKMKKKMGSYMDILVEES